MQKEVSLRDPSPYRGYKNMNRGKIITLVVVYALLISTLAWIGWAVAGCIGNYGDNVYPFSQANAKFARAIGTNNLNVFAEYSQDGLDILEPYSGNEDYWFPTDRTDIDFIKLDIQIIINNSLIAANSTTYGSDAYQEALDNAKESLSYQIERIDSVETLYMGFGESYIGIIWSWIGIFVLLIILFGISVWYWDYEYY